MKKLLLGTLLLAAGMVVPIPTMAEVNVHVNIGLPPPIVFAAPPVLIVLPETYVYVVPDTDADIFFYNGWWWRPWEGRWYRSRYYNSGWAYYQRVPSFYAGIHSGWRSDYRDRRWRGHQWDYQRIPHQQVQQNWKGWEKNRHWEKQQTWGVKNLKPRTQAQQPSREAAKPQVREAPKSQVREAPKSQVREAPKPQVREAPKPQVREAPKPQVREAPKPQVREAPKPQVREAPKSQHQETGPQSREGQSQQSPQQQQGGHERGGGEKQDRR